VLTAGFAGVLAGATYATFYADRVGRRASLVGLASLAAAGGLALAFAPSTATAIAAAFLGMLNTQGSDRGGAQALETAILPSTTSAGDRTRVFAWYNALQDTGGALGAALAAVPQLLEDGLALSAATAFGAVIVVYAALLGLAALLYARLSTRAEPERRAAGAIRLPHSRRAIRNFSLLAALDAFGGGFIGSALIAYFFYERFGVDAGTLAALFLAARIMTVLSHFAAAWLSRRIGLVNTMVFTHIPSSLLLLTIPIMPTFAIAAALFILREGLSEMDVPTRQSYLMAIVRPEERSFASGMSQLARAAGRVTAPGIAGIAIQFGALWTPLAIGATLKIVYDLLLWRAFRHLKPPEEQAAFNARPGASRPVP
jgi:MFS family permease